MQNHLNNIAVLFFSRSAESEAEAKSFSGDGSLPADSRLADELISHTARQIAQSGLPSILFDEKRQRGRSFGERFSNAFKEVFAMGFEYVIAVGNDTPELQAEHIEKAARDLFSGKADVVLGPACDGGTWMTAYSRRAFETAAFRDLPWQSPRLYKTMLDTLDDDISISVLEPLADIDDAHTLKQFLKRNDPRLRRLLRSLQSIIASITLPGSKVARRVKNIFLQPSLPRRAPPFA